MSSCSRTTRAPLARHARPARGGLRASRPPAARASCSSVVDEPRPDALVVDIGLPDADGRDVVPGAARAQGVARRCSSSPPATRSPTGSRASHAGGDDYLTKPFAFAELVARLHALLQARRARDLALGRATCASTRRRTPRRAAATHVDADADRVPAARAPRRAPGEAVRRRELVRAAWPHGAIVHDNTLDVYIARLRRKLATLRGAPEIATVHGVGYRSMSRRSRLGVRTGCCSRSSAPSRWRSSSASSAFNLLLGQRLSRRARRRCARAQAAAELCLARRRRRQARRADGRRASATPSDAQSWVFARHGTLVEKPRACRRRWTAAAALAGGAGAGRRDVERVRLRALRRFRSVRRRHAGRHGRRRRSRSRPTSETRAHRR